VANTNDPPYFTSTPSMSATEDSEYVYEVAAADDDLLAAGVAETLTITAPASLPAWLTLTDRGDGTAVLRGTPANADVGPHTVTLRVTDAAGAWAEQAFAIVVANTNDPPYFTSTPSTSATEDGEYVYEVAAADDDLLAAGVTETLTITAPASLPAWLTLTDRGDGTAVLRGTPGNADVGSHTVMLRVTDAAGAWAAQAFAIVVARAPMAGDVDCDGDVDVLDLQALEAGFGRANATWADGDFNGDRKVDSLDYILLKRNFGRFTPTAGEGPLTAGTPPGGSAEPTASVVSQEAARGESEGMAAAASSSTSALATDLAAAPDPVVGPVLLPAPVPAAVPVSPPEVALLPALGLFGANVCLGEAARPMGTMESTARWGIGPVAPPAGQTMASIANALAGKLRDEWAVLPKAAKRLAIGRSVELPAARTDNEPAFPGRFRRLPGLPIGQPVDGATAQQDLVSNLDEAAIAWRHRGTRQVPARRS